MAYDPFEVWKDIGRHAAAKEEHRRAGLSPAQRAIEDAAQIAGAAGAIAASVSLTLAPWAIGIFVIGRAVYRSVAR